MGEFVETLKKNIEVYQAFLEKLNADSNAAINNMVETGSIYTDEGFVQVLRGQVDGLKSEFQTHVESLNFKVKETIKNEKSKYFEQKKTKTTDYTMQVSNALKFLEIEGETITDEKAFLILKDFMGDDETIHLFKNVIEKQLKPMNAYRITSFKKTFGEEPEKEALLNTFEQMESTAKNLFIRPLTKQNSSILSGQEFISKYMGGYEDLAGPINLLNLAEIVENLVHEDN
ncbi:hypothetical protein [Carnobacterium pleistocenium]|uniref:hypothetical protein n=1 Tax=Carnobacterium pleistocenium TaxID=181073 RepID=UPI000555E7F7|nr:hypothetical protein [Carnobacterium pleistocenium]